MPNVLSHRLLTTLVPAIIAAELMTAVCSRADMVTQWSANLYHAAKTAAQLPPVEARTAAMVQTAVYDAVNGIVGKYEPYFVTESAPPGARPEAAAAEAAYTVLKALYPSQAATFDAEMSASLAEIPGHGGKSQSIARGLAWGQYVAGRILAWRTADGFSSSATPYFGGTAPGIWRSIATPTNPDGTLAAVLPQFPFVTPFAMTSPSQFRPGPPPDLTSARYAADVNEVEQIGCFDSTTRTPDQTQLALLWQAVSPVDEYAFARSALSPDASLVDNARLLALLAIAGCDSLISIFDAKYTYNFWRPYHAIRLADTDGNPLTTADPTWNALFLAPRHQEYPSAHSIVTGSIMRILSRELGDEQGFTLAAPGYPSFTWSFARFSDAAAQVKEARVWAGIHYRNSCQVGGMMGVALGDYVLNNFLRPVEESEN